MKKKILITVVILAIIAITAIAIFFAIKGISKGSRNYEIENVSEYNYFVLQENNKYGVIDKSAKTIIQPNFSEVVIPNPQKAVFICTNENKEIKALNEKNEQILTNFEEVTGIRLKNIASNLMYEKSVLKYKENDKYGLIDYSGKKITDAIYNQIQALEYKEGELLVEQNGNYGVINIKGTELVPIKYLNIHADGYYTEKDGFKNCGYIVAVKSEKGYRYGYIDKDGKETLETNYNELSRITDIKDDNNIYFIASKNGQYGIYKNSEQLINNEYQSISYNKNNKLFLLEKSKKFGICDIDGKQIIDVKYTQIDVNGNTLYAKTKEGTVDVYDAKGNKSDLPSNIYKYDVADGKYNLIITNKDGKSLYSVQDKAGNEVIKPEYTYLEYLYDDLFIASNMQNQLGILDVNGNTKLDFKYSSIQKIKESRLIQALIKDENKVDIFNSQIEKLYEIEKPTFVEENDYIKVYNETDTIYLSKEEKLVENTEVYKQNKLFAKKQNDKWSFADKNGAIKVNAIYDKVTDFNEFGYAGINQNGKWGAIDQNGNIVVEPTYELKSEPDFLGKYYKVVFGYGECYFTNK
ncbi:MAG: WG repeat-containing protein [Clostridia bacterium]|nr:WG repeat-containing protein [Clostridia bacterium]